MKKLSLRNWIGLALSGLMLTALPACSVSTTSVASASKAMPSGARKAALLLSSAQAALARGDSAGAIRDAEAAVLLSPGDAGGRATLGRAYLAAGRFHSADTAFADALSLDPTIERIGVTRALAQIALGQRAKALDTLDEARGRAGEADIGLALALAGKPGEAILRLETAARTPGADARTRQNLALAYALQGRWSEAQATAALDVPADKLGERMRRWSQLGQRADQPAVQVAMLLGVIPVADAGQPEILALARTPAATPVRLALANPTPPEPAPLPQPAVAEAAPVAVEAQGPTISPRATATPSP